VKLFYVLTSLGNLKYKLKRRIGWKGWRDVHSHPVMQFKVADQMIGYLEIIRDDLLIQVRQYNEKKRER